MPRISPIKVSENERQPTFSAFWEKDNKINPGLHATCAHRTNAEPALLCSSVRFLLTPGFFFPPKKGWQKLKADIPAKFGTDSLLRMFYKLLTGNFSISSIQLLASKVIETEKDEGNWEAWPCPEGQGKAPGDPQGDRSSTLHCPYSV